jgi:hypothetical protein
MINKISLATLTALTAAIEQKTASNNFMLSEQEKLAYYMLNEDGAYGIYDDDYDLV